MQVFSRYPEHSELRGLIERHDQEDMGGAFWDWKPEDGQGYLPVKHAIRVVKHAELNGVRFSPYVKGRTTDNSCVACRYENERGQEVAYGNIKRIFEHELGGKKSLVFEVVWLENRGVCKRTLLPVVGQPHQEWNNLTTKTSQGGCQFVDAGRCEAVTYAFWPKNGKSRDECYVLQLSV